MRAYCLVGLMLSIGMAAACSDDTATSVDRLAQRGLWGSSQASLAATDSGATIQIVAGNCYGSYGDLPEPVPAGSFTVNGTYTQLMGAYPGKIEYPARFFGAVEGDRMTISVTVADLQRTFGPYVLIHGVNYAVSRCLYP
jgi:hypothetical protein